MSEQLELSPKKKLLLIDGNSVAFRAFFALHSQLDRFTNHDGLHTNAIYAFKTMLDHVIKAVHPDKALVAFDAGKTTFRTAKYSDYKGGRSKTPEELSEQMPYLRELLTGYGIKSYDLKDWEADDIIGTLAREGEAEDYQVIIVTGDRDLTQLTTDKTTVAITQKGVSEIEYYTPAHVQEKFGLTPTQIIDMKGLTGDTSDNYPGVTKVGEKTAIKLLTQFETVEGVYEHLDDIKQSKMKDHLIEDHDQAVMSKDLATIRTNAPLAVHLADIDYTGPDLDKLISFYKQMDFNNFLKQLQNAGLSLDLGDETPEQTLKDISCTELTAHNLDLLANFTDEVSFILEMPDENYHLSTFAGVVVTDGKQTLVSREIDLLQTAEFKALLENDQIKKNVFNAKAQYVGLNRLGVKLAGIDFDLLLVSYLLDTNDNSNDLGSLAQQHGYVEVETDEAVYGKGAKRGLPDDDTVFFNHLARKALAIQNLHDDLFKELATNEQTDLYRNIELPLTLVLADMEIAGVRVDTDQLIAMREKFKEQLATLQQTIYQEAGEEFNINSTKQLGVILFEKMKLPVIKKTKTGYSTSVDVLEQLASQVPIVENILAYRGLAKLQSTYIEGLLKVVHSRDQKVHTRYLQTLTQTGRLSSVDPNLQNIPIQTQQGREIRKAFVPSHEGWQIFSSDYSQVELRVLAHITGDANLQEAFREDEDIHAATARRIFGLTSNDEVTPLMRRQAKATNFGIVYGISDYGLSQNLGISRQEAKQFIETYFREYPDVKKYTEDVVTQAQKDGYVETITHRRRYLPDINAKSFNQRSFAARTAMNTPIQGSAADIIKIAMINMQKALKDAGLKATMLLQIHDELVFEAPLEEIPKLEQLVPSVMDSAVKLAIPLKVESAHGDSWYDAKG
ncbi:DNA polymerase I [Furfurilactobacillus siliginis]|uniref:DNA polymerase I n=1 Tax=Furfurilactobacillus siliginis TaxID=348151 RepID=A0A0R2L5I0_9LACO|nr:DNA polymerase I [Furfurilactobacillus siliginis]KRN94522.1 dna polymerase i [Furfurilactobacillus siliginis]GEK28563.1 DNA polymerase [Furfurilactobacillus siliginis]